MSDLCTGGLYDLSDLSGVCTGDLFDLSDVWRIACGGVGSRGEERVEGFVLSNLSCLVK